MSEISDKIEKNQKKSEISDISDISAEIDFLAIVDMSPLQISIIIQWIIIRLLFEKEYQLDYSRKWIIIGTRLT